MISKQQFEAT